MLEEHAGALGKLLQKYRDSPMSLADACVVRMAEIHERHAVLTLDSDLLVYRKRAPPASAHSSGSAVLRTDWSPSWRWAWSHDSAASVTIAGPWSQTE
jgi:hypothetical protein